MNHKHQTDFAEKEVLIACGTMAMFTFLSLANRIVARENETRFLEQDRVLDQLGADKQDIVDRERERIQAARKNIQRGKLITLGAQVASTAFIVPKVIKYRQLVIEEITRYDRIDNYER